MAKAPQFPWFVRNWLCSRTVATMSGDAVKAFSYLLCEAWLQEPRATLPNDDNELASMSRLNRVSWDVIKSDVMRAFKVGACDQHKGRLYSELQLEVSRKFENNQRFKNKNAKRTRNKRDTIACVQANANANTNTLNSLNARCLTFKEQVLIYKSEYRDEMLIAFYEYWSEPNKSKTKMRFELQPTWDLLRRLRTWAGREKVNTGQKSKNNIGTGNLEL